MTTPISKPSSLVELAGSSTIRTQTLVFYMKRKRKIFRRRYGIGYSFRHTIVEELLGLRAKVRTCSRNAEELSSCLMGWENLGFEVSGSVCDVSKRAQRERPMEIVSSVFDGKLNILLLKIRIVWERKLEEKERME
ncbi:hypothetical protein F8388_024695 [Cannabis sativa]|uniref:Uncharacterized protein n=1 Tax=Cannabis sativa TaxID=3483 RepID=A0A7J6GC51_CANSA|nr:hypothetical protein F8388_024695 [Cannabis sativa]